MNTKSAPSLYENCISRLSTTAVSTFTPALNVLSTTLPDMMFFSLVRTNAPPLPGLTCWNSTTVQSSPPSSLSTRPFFRSFVVATVRSPAYELLYDQQFLGRQREELRAVRAHDEGVLDAHATPA